MLNQENKTGIAAVTDFSAQKRNTVRQQLESMLADPLFKHSKRCTDFLRFTVLRALDETTEVLRERTIGVELFGKLSGYDTNLDPVVRVTATEVRKRLHQYYLVPGRDSEVRIEFPQGSYLPKFIAPDPTDTSALVASAGDPKAIRPTRLAKKSALLVLVAAPYVALCVFLLGTTSESTVDEFWNPIANTRQVVTFCVPARNLLTDPTAATDPAGLKAIQQALTVIGRPSRVAFSDAIAFSTINGLLRKRASEFQFRGSADAELEDLEEGPVVLIGAFSNRWTQQFQGGRFRFSNDDQTHFISDTQNPSSRTWAIDNGDSHTKVDYGLVSRILNPTTGTYFVTIAGIHGFGTEAAAECAAATACLDSAAKLAPGDWKKSNIQIVIQADVINKDPGRPKVLAAYLWR